MKTCEAESLKAGEQQLFFLKDLFRLSASHSENYTIFLDFFSNIRQSNDFTEEIITK